MIEDTVIDHLKAHLDVPVSAQRPSGPPASFVVVRKSGSDENNTLCAANITVYSHAPTPWQTMTLNKQVKAAMALLRDESPNVFACRCTTDYDSPDTRYKEPRYAAVFKVTYLD